MTTQNHKAYRSSGVTSELITSLNNPSVKAIRSLSRRSSRDRTGLFFVEGLHIVAEASELQVPIETLVFCSELLTSDFGRELVRRERSRGTPYLKVTPAVFASLSQREKPQGIGAVLHQRWEALGDLRLDDGQLWVALDTVQYPGNLGTIVRTCDAVGGAGVVLLGATTDPHDPAAVRASTGAILSQRLVRTDFAAFASWKRQHSICLVGTSPDATTDYRAISYPTPLVLCMGGERAGLPQEQQTLCDAVVKIPMVGRSDSLNLAVATSVMLYEIFHASQPPPLDDKAML